MTVAHQKPCADNWVNSFHKNCLFENFFWINTLKLYLNLVCYELIYVIGFVLFCICLGNTTNLQFNLEKHHGHEIHVDKAGNSKNQTETEKKWYGGILVEWLVVTGYSILLCMCNTHWVE